MQFREQRKTEEGPSWHVGNSVVVLLTLHRLLKFKKQRERKRERERERERVML
jgi:hypothetical protein